MSDVLVNHRDWKTKHYGPKRSSVTLDHSNIAQWLSNDINLRNVDIKASWQLGLHNASIHLLKSGLSEMNFIEIVGHLC